MREEQKTPSAMTCVCHGLLPCDRALLPKSIHAVTAQGFELKVALFVIASSLNCYLNL